MNSLSVKVTPKNIKYSIKNKNKNITDNSILIIFDYKCNIINSITNIYINSQKIKELLFYINNNHYILVIRNKSNEHTRDATIYDKYDKYDILNNYDPNVNSEIQLYRKINKKYEILSHLKGPADLSFIYNIPSLITTDMDVLCVLDEFSYNCFKYECNLVSIDFNNWKNQIENIRPHFIFVESVWNAVDSEFSFSNLEMLQVLKDILYQCNLLNIRTIFWNKEDDINYNNFIKHALLFDIIFTSDDRCIPRYKNETSDKHHIVECLEFACQPKLHNPLNQTRNNDIFFAGRWYKDFPERNKQIESLINIPSYRNRFKMDVFDRTYIKISGFPEKYKKIVKPKLTYIEVNDISKNYKVMLNVNTITKSNTMFSRRVYEGLASGACVVSTESVGIENKFKDIVYISHSIDNTCDILDTIIFKSNLPELSFRSHKSVIKTDNYKVRMEKILDTAFINYNKQCESIVSVIGYYKGNIDVLTRFVYTMYIQTYTNIIITIFVDTEETLIYIINHFNKLNRYVRVALNKNVLMKMKMMSNMYIAILNINKEYNKEYIDESMLPFLYIDESIKYIGGVNKKSYNFINPPNKDATFYRINTKFS